MFFSVGTLNGRTDTHYIGTVSAPGPTAAKRRLEGLLEETGEEDLLEVWEHGEERWCMKASERLYMSELREKTI